MWYSVLVDDVVVGTVDLPPQRLAAGRLAPDAGYARIARRIREASRVLLTHGVYGPPLSARPDVDRRRARGALAAAAMLRVELALWGEGERASTVFVNLIEGPVDGGVVVVAFFDEAPASTAALAARPHRRDADAATEP